MNVLVKLYDLFLPNIKYYVKYKNGYTKTDRFNHIYSIALKLYNENKINDFAIYLRYSKIKDEIRSIKGQNNLSQNIHMDNIVEKKLLMKSISLEMEKKMINEE